MRPSELRPHHRSRRPNERRPRNAGHQHRAHDRAEAAEETYWGLARTPMACLLFVSPLLLLYEAGQVAFAASGAPSSRTGADLWIREALSSIGLAGQWVPPAILVAGLVCWQALQGRPWNFRISWAVGMMLESACLAVALLGLSELVDLGLTRLESGRLLLQTGAPAGPYVRPMLGYLGAGIYEEAIFRLLLIPLLYNLLRLLQAGDVVAGTLALTGSALLFSLAHHVGGSSEPFTWFAFVFRWLAGVYFAAVFATRGFGIAVGTHASYDVLVGSLGWHL